MLKGAGLAAVLLLGLLSCGHHTKMAQYRDAHDGWTVVYPASMHRAVVADYKAMVSWHGVLIANSAEVKTGGGTFFRRFPPDGAAFAMLQMEGGPGPNLSGPEARFPLSRSEFWNEGAGPPPRPHYYGMLANGSPWAAYTWFGPKASRADQERIWRIAESLRFPPQRPGTMTGAFYVMQKASRYPLGAVVKVQPKSESGRPFFLVHAPGGFYALGWESQFEPACHMRFDRKRFAFVCATGRGSWNRIGESLVSPDSELMPNDSLALGQVKVGRDGQLLVGNWVLPASYARYERRFWPED